MGTHPDEPSLLEKAAAAIPGTEVQTQHDLSSLQIYHHAAAMLYMAGNLQRMRRNCYQVVVASRWCDPMARRCYCALGGF